MAGLGDSENSFNSI